MSIQVKVINTSSHILPTYATPGSAGLDIRAHLPGPILLPSGARTLIPTGLFIELPEGYEAQIRPRSGLALHHGVTVLNSPGTIDADFRKEIQVLLINHGYFAYTIQDGDRIAQMVVARHEVVEWEAAEVLADSERKGGFGHSGVK